jgi:phage tail-like protein
MAELIPGYRFRVDFGIPGLFMTDTGFSKISGIGVSINEDTKEIGASSTNKVNVIKSIDFTELVMERASKRESALILWLNAQCMARRKAKIPIVISVLDRNGLPIFCYTFFNAYPIKWETLNIDSQASGSGAILTDKITFKYDYYEQVAIPDPSGLTDMASSAVSSIKNLF